MMEKIFAHIDAAVDTVVELETQLTKHPALSPDSGGDGELKKVEFLEAWLRARGLTQLERYDAPDPRVSSGIRPNLVATIPGASDTRRLWIMAHTDVVPPGDLGMWRSDPWTVVRQDGRLVGRGVEDNQQGLTAAVAAALALTDQGITPPHTVKLLFVADEEMGSDYGMHWLVKHHRDLFRSDDMVLIPDGGDEKGETIEVAEKNLLWLKIITTGVQCHGSRPDQGANAHLAAAELAVRLHDELPLAFPQRDPLFDPPYSTFEPTKSEANVPNINTIPGDDAFYMDMRVLPQYGLQQVLAVIENIMREVAAKRKVSMRHETAQRMESKPTAPDAPLVKLLSAAVKAVYGVDIDAAVWSRLHESAHQPNEFTLIENILGDAKVMARLMMEKR